MTYTRGVSNPVILALAVRLSYVLNLTDQSYRIISLLRPTMPTTTTTTTWLLPLLLLILGLSPASIPLPVITATAASVFTPPDYAGWEFTVWYYNTFDGTALGSNFPLGYQDTAAEGCYTQYGRCDYISVKLRKRFKLVGWDNVKCEGEPLFEIKGRNLEYYVPAGNWEGWQVFWL